MRGQFRETVTALAAEDPRIVVILGDISVYQFRDFQARFPDRCYNMGICEPTLISVAAGLASQGFLPFVHSIAPFVTERSLEQIKLDMAYNGFGGNVVSCGATFDYAWDGSTHHAYGELEALRVIPGMEVLQPGSTAEVDALLRQCAGNGRPTYVRLSDFPHDVDVGRVVAGKGTVLADKAADLTVMTAGPILGNVLDAVRDLPVNLVYFHTLKPLDRALVERFRETRILVVHDARGLREAVTEVPNLRVDFHGLDDRFHAAYGTVHDLRAACGLDPPGIRTAVTARLSAWTSH